jgi:GNAT superfamily N-acetyltransferase
VVVRERWSSDTPVADCDMPIVEVQRTYLRLDPGAGDGGRSGDPELPAGVVVAPESPCAPATYRALYRGVGAAHHWYDRAAWSDVRIDEHLARPEVRVWVMRVDGEPAGFFELEAHADDGSMEIAYFGLLGAFHGRGLGRHLLGVAIAAATATDPSHVWLHTCTLDAPAALPNYVAQGFRPVRVERYTTTLPD